MSVRCPRPDDDRVLFPPENKSKHKNKAERSTQHNKPIIKHQTSFITSSSKSTNNSSKHNLPPKYIYEVVDHRPRQLIDSSTTSPINLFIEHVPKPPPNDQASSKQHHPSPSANKAGTRARRCGNLSRRRRLSPRSPPPPPCYRPKAPARPLLARAMTMAVTVMMLRRPENSKKSCRQPWRRRARPLWVRSPSTSSVSCSYFLSEFVLLVCTRCHFNNFTGDHNRDLR